MTPEEVTAYLVAKATPLLQRDLDNFGTVTAEEIAATAPVKTGALRSSVRWEPSGPLAGSIVMRGYGLPIERGHIVARWGTTKYPARHFLYKTGGYVLPNPFISRGVRSTALSFRVLNSDMLAVLKARVLASLDSVLPDAGMRGRDQGGAPWP